MLAGALGSKLHKAEMFGFQNYSHHMGQNWVPLNPLVNHHFQTFSIFSGNLLVYHGIPWYTGYTTL